MNFLSQTLFGEVFSSIRSRSVRGRGSVAMVTDIKTSGVDPSVISVRGPNPQTDKQDDIKGIDAVSLFC